MKPEYRHGVSPSGVLGWEVFWPPQSRGVVAGRPVLGDEQIIAFCEAEDDAKAACDWLERE
jgi:hypothetical protein